ncbi:TonB family protein [Sphingomonas arantia]|uniref:TonB family protein n=1 Tax=Sphingomonas arantia TaxID=1460676 RepID=A0ABW4TXR2_9SPHN
MAAAAPASGPARRRGHPWALIATLLLHAAVLLLVLQHRFESPAASDSTTPTIVELIAEPPPPPPPPPAPPSPPPPPKQPSRSSPPSSGAPRPANAPPARVQTAPLPETVDRTIPTPIPPLLSLPPITLGTALTPPIGIVGPPVSGNGQGGTGSGTANGVGDGTGNGNGDGRGPGYRRAIWLRRPTNFEMRPFWPAQARLLKLSGRVLLACTVRRSGQPDRCEALAETPAGAGFGAAAVAMSRTFRVRPVTRGAAVVDLPVLIPVTFQFIP